MFAVFTRVCFGFRHLQHGIQTLTPQSQRQLGAFNKSFPVAQMEKVPRLRLFVFGAGRSRELQSGMTGTENRILLGEPACHALISKSGALSRQEALQLSFTFH